MVGHGHYGWVFGFWWLVVSGHGGHPLGTQVPSDSRHPALVCVRPGFRLWHLKNAVDLLTTHHHDTVLFLDNVLLESLLFLFIETFK